MSVKISVEEDNLVVELHGLERFLAFRQSLHVPLSHVSGARMAGEIPRKDIGIKVLGAGIPGFIRAGTYAGKEGLVFWDVRHQEKAILIELHDEEFSQLVVEVEKPEEAISLISNAIAESS